MWYKWTYAQLVVKNNRVFFSKENMNMLYYFSCKCILRLLDTASIICASMVCAASENGPPRSRKTLKNLAQWLSISWILSLKFSPALKLFIIPSEDGSRIWMREISLTDNIDSATSFMESSNRAEREAWFLSITSLTCFITLIWMSAICVRQSKVIVITIAQHSNMCN